MYPPDSASVEAWREACDASQLQSEGRRVGRREMGWDVGCCVLFVLFAFALILIVFGLVRMWVR